MKIDCPAYVFCSSASFRKKYTCLRLSVSVCFSLSFSLSLSLSLSLSFSLVVDCQARVVSAAAAQRLADELGYPYMETSAKTGLGVDEAFQKLLQMVMQRLLKTEEEGRATKGKKNVTFALTPELEPKRGCPC